MRAFNLFLLMLGFVVSTNAQVKTPAASPKSYIKQDVGLSTVEVEYSRPSMKGREIFGDLVPYGKLWRTGANSSTKVTFGEDVMIRGEKLPKGQYALYTIPGKDEWAVIFYKNTSFWGTPDEYNEEDEALKVMVKPEMMESPVETFTIHIGELRNNSYMLGLLWADTWVGIPVEINTDEQVFASIEKAMDGPSGRDYFSAARYYMEADKDHDKALMWFDKAIEKDGEKFWVLRQKSLLQAKMGDKEGAIETAKRSLELAKEAGNDAYIKMNMDSIKEWSM